MGRIRGRAGAGFRPTVRGGAARSAVKSGAVVAGVSSPQSTPLQNGARTGSFPNTPTRAGATSPAPGRQRLVTRRWTMAVVLGEGPTGDPAGHAGHTAEACRESVPRRPTGRRRQHGGATHG